MKLNTENMNLQESIRKVLREELSARVRRRVPSREMEKEFLESFEDAYNLTKRRKISQINFLDELINTTANMMMDGLHWRFVSTLPKDEFWYEDISTELKNHYMDRITQMYNERKGINESILREETELPIYIIRRVSLEELDDLVLDIKSLIDSGYDESDAIYDTVRQFIASKQFKLNNDSEQSYWDSYIEVEEPLVDYVKSKLNIQESILREETNPIMRRIFRRVDPEKMDIIFGDGLDTMITRYHQNKHNWTKMNLDKFKSAIVSYVIVDLCIKYSEICFGAEEYYNKVWEFLLNNYSDVMEEKWKKIMSGEINESAIKEEKNPKKRLMGLVDEFGLHEAARMLGMGLSKLIEFIDIPIDSEIANDILVEMMKKGELKKKYREFEIHANSNGVFYWESMTNTGHFPGDVVENITVAATPFWDGVKYTPVELDWFTLFDDNGDIIYEKMGEGGFYKELKHQTNFESVDELLNWYDEFYLPEVYNTVMNTLVPKMHKLADYKMRQKE